MIDTPVVPGGRASAPASAAARGRGLLVLLARWNLLLALSVAASALMVQALAGVPHEPVAPLVAFLAMFAVYTLDRASDAGTDDAAHPERASFSRRNAKLMRALALAAYAAALALAAGRGWWAAAVALLPLAAVLVYTFPIVPAAVARRVGFRRVKEVFVLKNVHVSATLAGTPALLAAAAAPGAVPWAPVLAAGAFLLARWWINTVFFDLRDLEGDRANGLRTVPVALGRARTLRLLHAANALLGAAAVAAPLLGLTRPLFALLALGSVYAGWYLWSAGRGGDLHFLCDVVSDGELLAVGAVVLLAAG